MRINSAEYKQWKKHQNEKNLRLRTKKKLAKRHALTAQNEYRKLKSTAAYNLQTDRYEFHAPLNFSIINNPEETSAFFNDIIRFITNRKNFGKNIFIDISKISQLTIDALMYLLAIVNNLSWNFKNKYLFSGNMPSNRQVKKLFAASGFSHFVKYQGTEPFVKSNDTIQIMSGENCDTELAKKICDFVSEKANISIRGCSFLYNMIIELMSNTHRHAYSERQGVLHPRWYCFAEYDGKDTVSFSFMDTGAGIPATVRKNFYEQMDFLKVKGEYSYVVSALQGEFRTATKKRNRGKGLPKIREFCTTGKIKNLHIVTNKAVVIVNKESYDSTNINTSLCGTLYFWQIDLSTLKGVAA